MKTCNFQSRGRNRDALRQSRGRNRDALRQSKGRNRDVLRQSWGRNRDALRQSRGRNRDALRQSKGRNRDMLRQSRGRNRDVLLRTVEGTGCAPVRAGLGIGMCYSVKAGITALRSVLCNVSKVCKYKRIPKIVIVSEYMVRNLNIKTKKI